MANDTGGGPWPLALLLAPNPAAMARALVALLFGSDGQNNAASHDDPWSDAPAAPGSLDALLPQAGLTPAEAARVSGEAPLAEDIASTRKIMATGSAANAPPSASGSSGAPVPVESPYVQERWELSEYATASALSNLPQTLWRSSSAAGASENLIYGEGAVLLSALPSTVAANTTPQAGSLGLEEAALTGSALPAVSSNSSYIADGLGSVASVFSGGSVSATYSYSPWGEVSGADELPFFGYNSEEHAGGGTGLQYLRARFYDAASAAFPTADSYLGDVSDPTTLNRYAYCGGNPIAFSDPSGNERFSSTAQRTNWLKNNSAKGKQTKQNTQMLLGRQKTLPGVGAANYKKSLAKVPLYGVQASRLPVSAPRASQKWRTELPGRTSPVRQMSSSSSKGASGLSYAGGSSSKTSWSWSMSKSRGLFPHVVSYAQAQSQQIRERFCSREAKHMGDQVSEPVKKVVQVTHLGLDIAGFIPVLGFAPDLANALIYYAEGNEFEGLISIGAAIPFAGDVGNGTYKLAKHGDDIVDAATDAAKAISSVAKGADAAADSASAVERAVRAANKVEDYKPGERSSSEKLRNALKKFGDVEPDYPHAAHHIVPGGHPGAEKARAILDEYKISINSAANGVFLPSTKGNPDAAYHGILNRSDYLAMIEKRIGEASKRGKSFEETRKEILLELSKIKDELSSSDNLWVKGSNENLEN